MLVEFELPGFPPPEHKPPCLGCTALVPLGFTENNRTPYTEAELAAWERTIPDRGAPPDAVFPDPRGLVIPHDAGCEYGELPPVALWQRDIDIATRAWLKVQRAKGRSS